MVKVKVFIDNEVTLFQGTDVFVTVYMPSVPRVGEYCYLSNDDLFTLAMNIAFSGDTEAYKRWYFEYNEKTKGDPNYVDIFAAYLVCNVGYDVSGACALICLTDEKLEK